jgi:hypothetical protein
MGATTKNVDIKILSFFDDITSPKDFARSLFNCSKRNCKSKMD